MQESARERIERVACVGAAEWLGAGVEAHLARALLHLAGQEERASSQVLPDSQGQGWVSGLPSV